VVTPPARWDRVLVIAVYAAIWTSIIAYAIRLP
jgi:hypothetical protein